QAWRRAAASAEPERAPSYLLLAAKNLVRAGQIADGQRVLDQALAQLGIELPLTASRAAVSLMAQRARVRMRGLGFRPRPGESIDADELGRVDALFSAGVVLSMVDLVRSADAQTRYLLRALDAGEPRRAARALAHEASVIAFRGREWRRAAAILTTAEALAERSGGDEERGFVASARALLALVHSRWREARARSIEAEGLLDGSHSGVFFIRSTTISYRIWALFYWGRLNELSRQVTRLLSASGQLSGRDWYLETLLKSGLANVRWLAAGDVQVAREVRAEVMRPWRQAPGFLFQHKDDLLARVHIALYSGDGTQAWRDIDEMWPGLESSLLLKFRFFRVECLHARGRSALVAARAGERALLGRCER
ncbi:MAG: hypothetical protein AAGC55_33150, partial [Myxococcota bacterium]